MKKQHLLFEDFESDEEDLKAKGDLIIDKKVQWEFFDLEYLQKQKNKVNFHCPLLYYQIELESFIQQFKNQRQSERKKKIKKN